MVDELLVVDGHELGVEGLVVEIGLEQINLIMIIRKERLVRLNRHLRSNNILSTSLLTNKSIWYRIRNTSKLKELKGMARYG